MIKGTIHQETVGKAAGAGAILFQPEGTDAQEWVPRSTIPLLRRESSGVPCKAEIKIERWKIKRLGWEEHDDE